MAAMKKVGVGNWSPSHGWSHVRINVASPTATRAVPDRQSSDLRSPEIVWVRSDVMTWLLGASFDDDRKPST
jgi:hypothetical protein